MAMSDLVELYDYTRATSEPRRRRRAPDPVIKPARHCENLSDMSPPMVPRCDQVRWARCRRQAKRQGRVLLRHMRTGLLMLDGVEGWTFDQVEAKLFAVWARTRDQRIMSP
jgi:hypothetical protein